MISVLNIFEKISHIGTIGIVSQNISQIVEIVRKVVAHNFKLMSKTIHSYKDLSTLVLPMAV